jgi:small subunit ribosomal protein S18
MTELVAEVLEQENFDALDAHAVAKRLLGEEADKMGNYTWEDLAQSKHEQKIFKELGVENPAEVKKRMEENAESGVSIDPEDVEKLEGYVGGSENPILTAMGEDSMSLAQMLEVSRKYYEMAKLIPSGPGMQGMKHLPAMKLNQRVDDEKLYSRKKPGQRDFVLAEELDENAKLPLERDMSKEESKKKKCYICWCQNKAPPLDPMNVHLLLKFMNIEGRILPRRQTKLCAKWQRKVAKTIRRAKHLGVFSYKHGRFTVTDPFQDNPTHEDVLNELAKKSWERLYPTEDYPSLKKEIATKRIH